MDASLLLAGDGRVNRGKVIFGSFFTMNEGFGFSSFKRIFPSRLSL